MLREIGDGFLRVPREHIIVYTLIGCQKQDLAVIKAPEGTKSGHGMPCPYERQVETGRGKQRPYKCKINGNGQ